MQMIKSNKLILAAIIAVIAILVAVVVAKQKEPVSQENISSGKFLKDLQGNVDKVGTVVFKQQGHQLKVKFIDGTWVLPGKYNYPIEVEKIRDVVVNAERLEVIEKKTNEKERLISLGLGDPDDAKAATPRIVFMDASEDKIFADFIRGNEKTSGKIAGANELYVRNSGEDQAWSVTGNFPIKLDADALLNKKAYAIDASRMHKASFKRIKGKSLELTRESPAADFKLTNPVKTAKDGNVLNNMGTILSTGLVLADVAPRALKSFEKKSTDDAKFETYDGLTVYVQMLTMDDGKWITISAEGADEAKKAEADTINSIAKDWVYKVSGTTGDLFTKDFDSL
jgi:hypothetical protein